MWLQRANGREQRSGGQVPSGSDHQFGPLYKRRTTFQLLQSKMPEYKLTYLALRGIGECPRLILRYSGVEFEDIRHERNVFVNSPELKKQTPYGQLPVLEFKDGHKMAQSGAIVRFLAHKYGLDGKTAEERARADELYCRYYDCMFAQSPFTSLFAGFFEGDKDKAFKENFEPTVNKFLPEIVEELKRSGSGFLLPSGLSYIDFSVAEYIQTAENADPALLKPYPTAVEFRNRVHSLPQIRDYIKSRPKTVT